MMMWIFLLQETATSLCLWIVFSIAYLMFMTYNFYQSPLRQYINREIYRKPVGMITIDEQEYQYIIKRKSVL
jgi:hypothetical protein